jgi:hypothetical protein
MHRPSCPGMLRLLSIVFAAAMLVAPSAFGQPLRATVIHIEGVQDTWRVTDRMARSSRCTSPHSR